MALSPAPKGAVHLGSHRRGLWGARRGVLSPRVRKVAAPCATAPRVAEWNVAGRFACPLVPMAAPMAGVLKREDDHRMGGPPRADPHLGRQTRSI